MTMRILSLATLILSGLSGCDEDDTALVNDPVIDKDCRATATVPGWTAEPFKVNLSIQFPDGFEGPGMTGFEGPVFSKRSPDGRITVDYAYCGVLSCAPFGKTLGRPLPGEVIGRDTAFAEVELSERQFFCTAGDTVGILYTNDRKQASGRYFMRINVNGDFREAADIQFTAERREEVEQVLGSIAGI